MQASEAGHPGTLEARVLEAPGFDAAYAEKAFLRAMGPGPAHLLSFSAWNVARWDELVDGVVVFREERPPTPRRGPQE